MRSSPRPAGLPDTPYAGSARRGRMRTRRGRGKRGPLALPGPLAPGGVPVVRSPREEFDATVLASIERLRPRFADELDRVEFGVEDVPLLPQAWSGAEVPLASVVRPESSTAPRVVLFRLPVSQRARGRDELEDLVLTLVIEQLAVLWDRDADEIDPRP
ncbi:MAG: metallopeptidase family protein [Nocardioidaceae bacterium]